MLTKGMVENNLKETQKGKVRMSTIPDRANRSNTPDSSGADYGAGEGTIERTRPVAKAAIERRRKQLAKWTQLGSLLLVTLESALTFRVLFKLIAANPGNPFAHFLYQVTQPFAAPFMSLVGTPAYYGSAFEISTLIGMAVYGALYWIFIRLVWVIFNPAKAVDADKYEPDL